MGLLLLLLVFWTGFVVYLFAEKHRLDKCRRSVPIRIAVNGTRGKTGAVRMIASALRANGIKTCAKTSGSETRFIYPDGSEEAVARNGPPSVIEQARVLQKAAALGAKAVVCEIMGIQSEYQIPESKKILDPVYTVIVNARVDHGEQGESEAEVMKNYLAAVPSGSRFFCSPNTGEYNDKEQPILELCRCLGLDEKLCGKAMREAEMDRGAFRIFRCGKMNCCNLFAANDIQSTRILMDSLPPGFRVGLFNSRRDRGERSLQFVKALSNGVFDDIRIFFVMGSAASFFRRKLPGRTLAIKSNDPEKIMDTIQKTLSEQKDFQSSNVQILGMGNIKGAEALLDYWHA
jgi:UDP-N-acetylmuramyl pentapeptide synthase